MKMLKKIPDLFLLFIAVIVFTSCDQNSSPEGRMTIHQEKSQKEIMESMQRQNAEIMDSLRSIRADLQKLQAR